jgi:23S rRNA (pseudouridine1915-N3)-methyltransferase
MALKLIVVGKTKESFFVASEQEYLKRIKRYLRLDYLTLKSSKNQTQAELCLAAEEKEILGNISKTDYVILLDEKGKEYTSRDFAKQLNKWMTHHATVVFIIGGAFGFSERVKGRANALVSMSQLTFPHHLARTVFLEQLYRAFTILKGENYHND